MRYSGSITRLRPLCRVPQSQDARAWAGFIGLWDPTAVRDIVSGRPFHSWRAKMTSRGMDPWRDVVDWVGGLPFEVAKPEKIFDFFRHRGSVLCWLKTCGGGHGCNQYVLARDHV